MLCNLTFKKSFGISTLPADFVQLFLELGNSEYKFTINNRLASVNVGKFGSSKQEKIVISHFFHSDERDLNLIPELLTIDIMFSVDFPALEIQQESNIGNIKIDNIVEPFINDAFSALTRLIDAHRTSKYNLKHRTDEWKRGMVLIIPEVKEAEFNTFLFYKLEISENIFVGCFSKGNMTISSSTDNILINQEINNIVADEIPLNRKLIVLAWEYLFREDYRNSVIYAATVLELVIIKTIQKNYIKNDVATISQIEKFLDNVSNRLLCTVIMGSLGVGDQEFRDKIASVFDIRNGLVHGKRKRVTKGEAETVINDTEELLEILRRFDIETQLNANIVNC